MRRLACIALALAALSPTVASAADPTQPPGVRSQFVIFDGQSFVVGPRGPEFELARAREDARFARMLQLKKELLPGIAHSRKDPVFK